MCPWNVFTLRSAGSHWICQNVLWSVISYSDWVTKCAWELWMWQLTRTNGSNGLGPVSGQKSEERKRRRRKKNIIIITGEEKEKTGSRSFVYYIIINIICLSAFRTTLPILCICVLFFSSRRLASILYYSHIPNTYIYIYNIYIHIYAWLIYVTTSILYIYIISPTFILKF